MKNLCYLMSIILVVLSISCKDDRFPKASITLINKSDTDINYYFAFGGKGGILYPDTTLPSELTPPFPEARKGHSGYYDCNCTEEEIFEYIPSDTLSLYIFHPDTLSKYSWDQVRNDYNFLKRYDLSLGDLLRLDFEVTYPPDTSMEGVKMYPPE